MKSKKTPKSIIISHAYSADNKGDAALLSVLVQEVRREFNPDNLTILTIDNTTTGEMFEGVPIKSSFMHYAKFKYKHKLTKLLYGTFIVTSTTVCAYLNKYGLRLPLPKELETLVDQYKKSDLIIAVGGGYLRGSKSIASIYNLVLLLHPILLSGILGKPTVLFTQSIGPFYHKTEFGILKHVLNKYVVLTIVRENISAKILKDIGIKKTVRSVDAGFLLNTKSKMNMHAKFNIPQDKLIIGVTARAWGDVSNQNKYQETLARTLDYLVGKYAAFIVFIPQVTSTLHNDDDRVVNNLIRNKMKLRNQSVALRENYNHHQIKALYDSLDLIIGTRFHSVIFSLTSIVPALAIEYEHKTGGIMSDLQLERWVIKIDDVTEENLKSMADDLISESEEYRAHLRKVLPSYIDSAHRAIELTKNTYKSILN